MRSRSGQGAGPADRALTALLIVARLRIGRNTCIRAGVVAAIARWSARPNDPRPIAANAIDTLNPDLLAIQPDGVRSLAPEVKAINQDARRGARAADRHQTDDYVGEFGSHRAALRPAWPLRPHDCVPGTRSPKRRSAAIGRHWRRALASNPPPFRRRWIHRSSAAPEVFEEGFSGCFEAEGFSGR